MPSKTYSEIRVEAARGDIKIPKGTMVAFDEVDIQGDIISDGAEFKGLRECLGMVRSSTDHALDAIRYTIDNTAGPVDFTKNKHAVKLREQLLKQKEFQDALKEL